ncbi:MAG: hypothetical protein JWP97_2998 [Labilithrix sp.]|nr:hypothetical protein [Labilithrix sp.]
MIDIKPTRARTLLVVTATGLLACSSSGSANDTSADAARACTADAECSSDAFCDLGRCAPLFHDHGAPCRESSYVAPVDAGLEPVKPPPDDPSYICGAYRCREGRCRSCESDEACSGDASVPGECYASANPELPGRRCGAPGSR